MSLPNLKLVSFSRCPYLQRALIVLKEKNTPYEIEYIDLSAPPPWFYDVSPLEKVPVLLVDDEPLFESMVICDYIDDITEGSLYPDDAFVKAQQRAWIEFVNEINSSTFQLVNTNDEKEFKHLCHLLNDRFEAIEEQLEDGKYFSADEFSMISAIYAPMFRYHKILSEMHDCALFRDAPAVKAWGDDILKRQSVIDAVPDNYYDEVRKYLTGLDSVFSKKAAAN